MIYQKGNTGRLVTLIVCVLIVDLLVIVDWIYMYYMYLYKFSVDVKISFW